MQHHPIIGQFQYVTATEPLSLFLILKSFAAGCSAMTGIEAISNGVPAFKRPETRNAAITLTWMAAILSTLFIGITLLATSYHIEANTAGHPTVIGQIAQQVFTGPLFFMFPVFQLAALFILIQAANTSYFDFPRVASLLARDKFLPSQFAFRGDRLAFSTGIVSLAVFASLLLIAFKGDTTRLINLYVHHRFIVPIALLDNVSVRSLAYARSISPYVIAAHVAVDPHDVETVRSEWERLQKQIPKEEETQLVVIESPYRALARPLLAYIDTVHELHPKDTLTVILPEFVVAHRWEKFLHNQMALQLRAALLSRPGILVTSVLQHMPKKSRYRRIATELQTWWKPLFHPNDST